MGSLEGGKGGGVGAIDSYVHNSNTQTDYGQTDRLNDGQTDRQVEGGTDRQIEKQTY